MATFGNQSTKSDINDVIALQQLPAQMVLANADTIVSLLTAMIKLSALSEMSTSVMSAEDTQKVKDALSTKLDGIIKVF